MASGTFYPAASADDGIALKVNFWRDTYDYLDFGNQGNHVLNAAVIRFPSVAIPQGVTITSAFVRLTAYVDGSSDPVNVNCHFEDVDDATQIVNAAGYRARTLTSAVAWNSVAAWTDGTQYDTPSLVSILQTVINRVGWSENNAVLFSLENNSSAYLDYRRASSFDYLSGNQKAELHVEWTVPDPNVNVSATTATLTITPNAATVIGATGVYPSTVALTITPNAASVVWGIGVNANTATLTITPNAATVRHDHDILATAAALTIAPQAATVKLNVPVSATTATLTIAPFAADVEVDIVHVNATTATLTITANAAAVKYDIPVNATTAALTITPNAATVWDGAAWAVWIAANESRATKYYYFILTGDADSLDDVTIPISSFQARRSYSSPTYLSVVIKDLTYATAISNRPNGDMQILMEYGVAGVIEYSSVIVEVDFEDITIDEGGSSSSISLVGRRTESYTPKAILLDNIVYGQLKNGKYRYRASIPNLYLSPGDTVTADGNEFTVDKISYIVSPKSQMMYVKEA